jgi:membrane-bound lytic murein transglycosylase B
MNAKLFSSCVLVAAGLVFTSGCTSRPGAVKTPSPPQPTLPAKPPAPSAGPVRGPADPYAYAARHLTGDYAGHAELEKFIDRMATKHGFPRDYLYGLFSQVERKQTALNLMGPSKPQLSAAPPRPGGWTRYRAKFLTEKHIATGASFWARHEAALQRAYQRYGVSPEYIMGIMGVETIYGGNVGNFRVLDVLATLALDYPRRADYFTGELENFLVMARQEGIDPLRPKGSYAGAMGLGQFMPGSFLKYAVDFDGDGRRDLWNADDAIGSVAHYFASHGWKRGEPVVSPARAKSASARVLESGLDSRYALPVLAGYGIYPTGTVPPRVDTVRLLRLSAEAGDEYWLGYDNFYVITRYNHSTYYAMAVHQLAQAVKHRYQQTLAAK